MAQRTEDGGPAPRRSPLTWTAVAASAALTVLLAVPALLSLLRALGVLEIDLEQSVRDRTQLVGVGNTESSQRIGEGFLAAMTLPMALVGLVLTIGIARLRPWAREGGIGVFGLGGALLVLLSVHGLLQDTPGRNSFEGLLGGLVVMGIAGLLMSSSCCLDVDRAVARQRTKERRAAEAARRARQATPYPRG